MALTKEQVTEQLKTVQDPELFKDLVTLNMVKSVEVTNGVVDLTIELTTPACPMKGTIENDIRAALGKLDGFAELKLEFTADVKATPQAAAAANNPLPGVKHIIAVGAGKGGVGKSTVSLNIAVGLARAGAKTGLLDGDIYGPSVPTLLGLSDDMQPRTTTGNMIVPFEVHGIKTMTIGKLVESDKPLIWRGPMAHGAFRQLATQTEWGELDYLIIDLPPGTGDVPLTMSQLLPLTGAVVVCTPQKLAQDDAVRAINMFRQLSIDVLGVVENMSYFIGDDGKEYDIFGKGGAQTMADTMNVNFLGAVPINMQLRANSDAGNPTANFEEGTKLAEELDAVVKKLAGQISVKALRGDQQPTLSIS